MTGLAGALVVATGLVAGAVLWTHQPAPVARPGLPPVTVEAHR